VIFGAGQCGEILVLLVVQRSRCLLVFNPSPVISFGCFFFLLASFQSRVCRPPTHIVCECCPTVLSFVLVSTSINACGGVLHSSKKLNKNCGGVMSIYSNTQKTYSKSVCRDGFKSVSIVCERVKRVCWCEKLNQYVVPCVC